MTLQLLKLLVGLVALMVLGVTGIHLTGGAARVERMVKRQLEDALSAADAPWASADVDGQNVTLRGAPPSPAAGAAAELSVRRATGRGGRFFGAVAKLDVAFSAPTPAPAETPTENLRVVPQAAQPATVVKTIEDLIAENSPADAASSAEDCQAEIDDILARAPVTFESNSAVIEPASAPTLQSVAAVILRCQGASARVEGHTDASGSRARNERLSQRRADAVAADLARRGVSREALTSVGRGEAQPIVSNESPAGRAQNRRIEIIMSELDPVE